MQPWRFDFFQVHRPPNHQPGGEVQALPRPWSRDRTQERSIPLHQRRKDHQIRRPRHQGTFLPAEIVVLMADLRYFGPRSLPYECICGSSSKLVEKGWALQPASVKKSIYLGTTNPKRIDLALKRLSFDVIKTPSVQTWYVYFQGMLNLIQLTLVFMSYGLSLICERWSCSIVLGKHIEVKCKSVD